MLVLCWASIAGPALGQRLMFAGVLNIARCEDIKTVAPLIESKGDSVTVDHLPGSKS